MSLVEELLRLDERDLVERLCSLTPSERKALSRAAIQAWEQVSFLDRFEGKPPTYKMEDQPRIELMVQAAGPPSEVRWPHDEQEMRILRSRGSSFMHELARFLLREAAADPSGGSFLDIRRLERSGELNLEADDEYVLAMISGLEEWVWPESYRPRADLLREDPELMATVFWRIFEIGGDRRVSLATVDGRGRGQSWLDAILELVADGTLDRGRVLDSTLAALTRDISANRAAWFHNLYHQLSPTTGERAERQGAYAALLPSRVNATVTLALESISILDNLGQLDDDLIGSRLVAPVQTAALATARRSLRLADCIRRRTPTAGAAVAAALRHPHADIQAAALKLLQSYDEPSDRDAVRAVLEDLTPTAAAAARSWLGTSNSAVVAAAVVEAATPALVPVSPITTGIELAEAFAVLLENPTDATLLELALGAATRLGPDPQRYASLARRAARLLRGGPVYEWDLLLDVVARVVLAAAHAPEPDFAMPAVNSRVVILDRRAHAVEQALRSDRRFQTWAEPTHVGGWVDPAVLLDRRQQNPEPAFGLDAVAALLRLGPNPAQRGLDFARQATEVGNAVGAALSYALGGPPPLDIADVDRPLWVAASRARYPLAHDPDLSAVAPGLAGGGADRPPQWQVTYDPKFSWGDIAIRPAQAPAPALSTLAAFPTFALSGYSWHRPNTSAPWHPWLATIWPGNIEPVLAVALQHQAESFENTPDYGPNRHALELLTTTVATLPPLAPYVLAGGLSMPALADRAAGVDAAVALLPDRIPTGSVATAMHVLAPLVPFTRWASATRDLAAAGRPVEARALLTALLPTLSHSARGMNSLVEALRDLHLLGSTPVHDTALRTWLTACSGTSKTARAAGDLLAL